MATFVKKVKTYCLMWAFCGLILGTQGILTEYATLTQCAEDASFMGYLDGATDGVFLPMWDVVNKHMTRTASTCNGAWIDIELQYPMTIQTVLLINRDRDTALEKQSIRTSDFWIGPTSPSTPSPETQNCNANPQQSGIY
jgi:hypothetical protein